MNPVPIPDMIRNRIDELSSLRSKEEIKNIRHQCYIVDTSLIRKEEWCPSSDVLAEKNYTFPRCENRVQKIKKRMQDILQVKGTFELYISLENKIIIAHPKCICQNHCVQ